MCSSWIQWWAPITLNVEMLKTHVGLVSKEKLEHRWRHQTTAGFGIVDSYKPGLSIHMVKLRTFHFHCKCSQDNSHCRNTFTWSGHQSICAFRPPFVPLVHQGTHMYVSITSLCFGLFITFLLDSLARFAVKTFQCYIRFLAVALCSPFTRRAHKVLLAFIPSKFLSHQKASQMTM